MGYISIMIVLGLICGGAVIYGLAVDPIWAVLGVAGALVFMGGGTIFVSYHQIGSHQVGVVQGISGVIQNQTLLPGTHTISPLDTVTIEDTGVQKAVFNGITAVSNDSQDVFLSVQLNYHLDPKAVVSLYKSTGGDWYDKFVPGAVNQAVKEETVKFATVELAPKRPKMSRDIEKSLKGLLEPHSIHVDSVYLLNVDYSQQFKNAIEQKQVQSQETARANLKAQEERNLAAGDRDATVARAQGQAQANKLLARSLTSNVIRFEWIEKVGPHVKAYLPSSGFFNLGTP